MSEDLIIEFPKKYSVRNVGGVWVVDVPVEYIKELERVLKLQPWIAFTYSFPSEIHITPSKAYEYTDDDIHSALCRIIEHVMKKDVTLDMDVWGEVDDE